MDLYALLERADIVRMEAIHTEKVVPEGLSIAIFVLRVGIPGRKRYRSLLDIPPIGGHAGQYGASRMALPLTY
jgi:hypothetical protein